jgi:ABC-type transporter Mla MlaB component
MAEPPPKDGESFLRKVVRFVANPATDWTDLGSRQDEGRELDMEKSELKAMIERKKRNDFVRKREFDMLRKVRREGLSPEQLAALGGSSRLDDSDRPGDALIRPGEGGVKAKIDEIEQQMVADGFVGTSRRPPRDMHAPTVRASFRDTTTRPAALVRSAAPQPPPAPPQNAQQAPRGQPDLSPPTVVPVNAMDRPFQSPPPGRVLPTLDQVATPADASARNLPNLDFSVDAATPREIKKTGAPAGKAPAATEFPIGAMSRSGAGPLPVRAQHGDLSNPFEVEVSEVVHDPELDEPVIAFANAEFEHCEQALAKLTKPKAARAEHAETWLVLFDLYRATGQQPRFEALANEYAQQFGWSAPQWFSLPQMVADAAHQRQVEQAATQRKAPRSSAADAAPAQAAWVSPRVLDVEAVAQLRSTTLQLPMPWMLEWGALESIEAQAATHLTELFRYWARTPVDMRWLTGDRVFTVLNERAPAGMRDTDPALWILKLDALRLINRPDQFDEAAIDYCMTYEVSPPSWERVQCTVRIGGGGHSSHAHTMSQLGDVATSIMEPDDDGGGGVTMATVELSGQLVGDIGATMKQLDAQLAGASMVTVNCAKLIRVDFVAAGDLLNWVLTKRTENRSITFADAHRLVAMFFGAMGINEHASVRVRNL